MADDSRPTDGEENANARWTRWDVVVLGVLVGLALALYHRIVFGGETLFARDVLPYVVPARAYAFERLLGGEMPLWNHLAFCGMPFFADISTSVFDPVQLLFVGLPAYRAVSLAVVVYHIIALTGAYVLGRQLGCAPAAALVCSVAFGMGGYLVSMDDSVLYVAGVAWTPWVLFSVDRLCRRVSFSRVVMVAVLLACTCLSGDVQWTYVTAVLAIAYGATALRGRRWRNLAWIAAAGTVAISLCAVQMVPFLEVALASRRAAGLEATEALSWAMHPARIIELGVPTPFGAVGDGQSFWARRLVNSDHRIPWAQGIYIGVGAIMFCTVAWRRTRARFFIALAFIGLILAVGPHTPVGGLLHDILPLWSSFRYPEKMIALLTFGLAMVAGLGAQEAFAKKRWRGPAALVLFLAMTWVACLVFRGDILSSIGAQIDAEGVTHVDPSDATGRLIGAVFWAFMLGAATLGVLILRARDRLSFRSSALVAAALLAGDLLIQGAVIQRTMPSEPLALDPPLAALVTESTALESAGRLYRYELPFLVPDAVDPSALNVAASVWQWHTLRPNMGFVTGVPYTLGYGVSMSTEFEAFWSRIAPDQDLAFTVTGTEYVLGLISADDYSNRSRYAPVAEVPGENVRLLRYLGAVPRLRVVYDVLSAPTQDSALDLLTSDGFDPTRSVVVTGAREMRSALEPTVVEVIRDDPEHIEVAVSTAADGMLLVADTWHPGWRARLDGEPAEVLRANYLFRAIELPAGDHTVELEFSPASWRVGRAVSMGTVALIFVVFLVDLRRRRKKREE